MGFIIMENKPEPKDRSKVLRAIGIILLAVGIFSFFIAPLEVICFYFFVEGGRFYFEGFNFGSFMFALITIQIIGYYLIAAMFIPLGYGHIKLRSWSRNLSLTYLWFWMVVGIPLTILFVFILITSKGPSLWLVITIIPLMYPVIPAILIWFYRRKDVELTLKSRDKSTYWIEKIPIPVLVIIMLFILYILDLNALLFLRGMFPFFGILLFDSYGALLISISTLIFSFLIWGLYQLKAWAWWGSVTYFGLIAISFLLTFSIKSLYDIYPIMNIAPLELKFFQNIPFQNFRLSVFMAIPLLVTLAIIIYSKKYFLVKKPSR